MADGNGGLRLSLGGVKDILVVATVLVGIGAGWQRLATLEASVAELRLDVKNLMVKVAAIPGVR